MSIREALVLMVYIITIMLIVSLAIIAFCWNDYITAAICGIGSVLYSVILAHEYKRGTWK